MAILPEDRTRRWQDIFRRYGVSGDGGHGLDRLTAEEEASKKRQKSDVSEALSLDPLWRLERPQRKR